MDQLWENMSIGVTTEGSSELLSVICVFYFLVLIYAYESMFTDVVLDV